jgi:hypothetical protein
MGAGPAAAALRIRDDHPTVTMLWFEFGAATFVCQHIWKEGLLTEEAANIQIQDRMGNWRTIHTTENRSQQILINMKSIQSRYPQSRVRAVNKVGQLIDLLD